MNILDIRTLLLLTTLSLVACSASSDGAGNAGNAGNDTQADLGLSDTAPASDAAPESDTHDALATPPEDGSRPPRSDAEFGGPPGGSSDGSLSNSPPESGMDGPGDGRGGGEGGVGGGECNDGFGGYATLTNTQGMADDVLEVIMEASEDGPGYFGLGVRLSQWTPGTTIALTVSDGGLTVAQAQFTPLEATCLADGQWSITDLRMNPLPSIEIDDIIELELEVTGEIRSEAEDEPAIAFMGTIRLQY